MCPVTAIGGEVSSSFRRRPNRKRSTHARCSLRRRLCRVGAGSIPRIGQAFGFGAGSGGLAGRQAVKRTAAPTGIVHALDAKRILRYASLGRSRNVIDRPESCCSEHRGERYSDHFRTIFAGGVGWSSPEPWHRFGGNEPARALISQALFTLLIISGPSLFAPQSFAMQIRHPVEGCATVYSARLTR